jgi:hypothetical protein
MRPPEDHGRWTRNASSDYRVPLPSLEAKKERAASRPGWAPANACIFGPPTFSSYVGAS